MILTLIKHSFYLSLSSLLIAWTSIINMSILGRHNSVSFYLFSIFLPLQYVFFAIQDLFRSTALSLSSKKSQNDESVEQMIGLMIISSLFMLTLFCVYHGYLYNVMKFLAVNSSAASEFSFFSQGMFLVNTVAVIHCILSAFLSGRDRVNQSFLFILLTCVMSFIFTLYVEKLKSYIFYQTLSYGLVCVAMFAYLIHRTDFLKANKALSKKNRVIVIKAIKSVGFPVAFSGLMVFWVVFVMSKAVAQFGEDVISGYGIAYRIQAMVYIVAISMGTAVSILMNHPVKLKIQTSFLIKTIVLSIISLVIFLFRDNYLKWLTQNDDIARHASIYLYYVAPSYFFVGFSLAAMTLLEQMGYGKKVVKFNFIYLVSIFLVSKMIFYFQINFNDFCKILSLFNWVTSSLFIVYLLTNKRHFFHL